MLPPTPYNDTGAYVVPLDGFFTLIVPILPAFPHNPWCSVLRTRPAGGGNNNHVQIRADGSTFDLTASPDALDLRWRVDYSLAGATANANPHYLKLYCVWNRHTPPPGLP